MKAVLFTLFVIFSFSAFSANTQKEITFLDSKDQLLVMENLKLNEVAPTQLAFDYYYTMDWLYEKTPFTYKLEAYV